MPREDFVVDPKKGLQYVGYEIEEGGGDEVQNEIKANIEES